MKNIGFPSFSRHGIIQTSLAAAHMAERKRHESWTSKPSIAPDLHLQNTDIDRRQRKAAPQESYTRDFWGAVLFDTASAQEDHDSGVISQCQAVRP